MRQGKTFKKVVLIITALVLTVSMGIVISYANGAKTPEANRDTYAYAVKGGVVKDFDDLLCAFTDVREGNTTVYAKVVQGKVNTVYLEEDIILKSPIIIENGSYTVLGAGRTIYRGSNYGALFLVTSDDTTRQSLTLADELTLDGMSDKYQADSGLVIAFGSVDLTASGVKFSYSDSHSEIGGAICIKTAENSDPSKQPFVPNVKVTDCEFLSCRASSGGAIAAAKVERSADGSVFLSDCSFSYNSTLDGDGYGYGGAIYIDASYFDVQDCTFTGNTADRGGAIYSGYKTDLKNCIFDSNTAINEGGSIYSASTVLSDTNMITNCKAKNGGAVAGRGSFTSKNDYISDNSAEKNGGAFAFEGALSLEGITLMNNEAKKLGGNLYLGSTGAKLVIISGQIFGGVAEYCGTIYCKGSLDIQGGAVGNGVGEFPDIFAFGPVKLGGGASIYNDVLALSIRRKDGGTVYPKIELSAVTSSNAILNIAYAKEKTDDKNEVSGFKNATKSGVMFFEGSVDAIKSMLSKSKVVSRGLLSYEINEEGKTSVRFIFLPIWACVLIGTVVAGGVVCAIIFRHKIKASFAKLKKLKDQKE